jgi:hypothetical protein
VYPDRFAGVDGKSSFASGIFHVSSVGKRSLQPAFFAAPRTTLVIAIMRLDVARPHHNDDLPDSKEAVPESRLS